MASEELRKRSGNHSGQFGITARKLAEFLESVEVEEAILIQRLSDLEARSLQGQPRPSTKVTVKLVIIGASLYWQRARTACRCAGLSYDLRGDVMRLDSIAATAPQLIERLERFRNFTMAHPRLVEARDELVDAIDGAAPGSLVFVLGPTGVGKTTVRMKVEDLLTRQMAPAMNADPGRLPFASVEVVPPDTGRFPLAGLFQPFAGGHERTSDRIQNHPRRRFRVPT